MLNDHAELSVLLLLPHGVNAVGEDFSRNEMCEIKYAIFCTFLERNLIED